MTLHDLDLMITLIFCIPFASGLNANEEVEFIKLAMQWRSEEMYQTQDCLFYNFGFERELPFNMISLDPIPSEDTSYVTGHMRGSTDCSFVLIGSKYVDKVNEVMMKIEVITNNINSVPSPLAAFIFGKNVEIDSSVR